MESVTLSLDLVLLLMMAIYLASLISSVTGSAGGVLMFAAMGTVIPARALVALHGSVQLVSNLNRTWWLRHSVDARLCGYFGVGVALGAVLATALIAQFASELIPLWILLALIGYTLFKPKRMPAIRVSGRGFFWVGLATGILGILAGAVDPFLAVFFVRDDMSKQQIVANKSMMQLMTHLTKIPAFLYLGFSFVEHWPLIAVFALAAMAGNWTGLKLLHRIDVKRFITLMKLALMLAAWQIGFQIFGSMVA
ncbi:sulfite exporter TauE/SafE family protein [Ferrimonas pelagia]|uniref:Probable membrane transporter protein n=1 Tax=Ferrimonas pelagia TaxID=1177826 RepID=A0ABP9EHM4_9GAMM